MINKHYVGLDVGGVVSPTAIAIIKECPIKNKYIIECVYAIPSSSDISKKYMRKIIAGSLKNIIRSITNLNAYVTLEEAFLQGVANKSFTKIIGAIENEVDVDLFVAPTSVKKQITGNGRAEKDEMAKALLGYNFDKKSKNLIKNLIKNKKWDKTDALAIALCGILKNNKHGDVK